MKGRSSQHFNNLALFILLVVLGTLQQVQAQANTATSDLADVTSTKTSEGQVSKDDLVFGIVGEGTLIVFIFILVALIICFFRNMTQCPNLCVILAATLPAIILWILIEIPKESLKDKRDKALPPEDGYLLEAEFFLSFLVITLFCALSCLCKVHFRPIEVKRIDSEIGADKYTEEEFSGLVIGGRDNKPKEKLEHEVLPNRDISVNQGSAQGSRRDSMDGSRQGSQQLLVQQQNQGSPPGSNRGTPPRGNDSQLPEGGSMSSLWSEHEVVPRRQNQFRPGPPSALQGANFIGGLSRGGRIVPSSDNMDGSNMAFDDDDDNEAQGGMILQSRGRLRYNRGYQEEDDEEKERLSVGLANTQNARVENTRYGNARDIEVVSRQRRSQRRTEFQSMEF